MDLRVTVIPNSILDRRDLSPELIHFLLLLMRYSQAGEPVPDDATLMEMLDCGEWQLAHYFIDLEVADLLRIDDSDPANSFYRVDLGRDAWLVDNLRRAAGDIPETGNRVDGAR